MNGVRHLTEVVEVRLVVDVKAAVVGVGHHLRLIGLADHHRRAALGVAGMVGDEALSGVLFRALNEMGAACGLDDAVAQRDAVDSQRGKQMAVKIVHGKKLLSY